MFSDYQLNYQDKETSYFTQQRSDLLPFVPKKLQKVLDIGCGNGNFGKMLKEKFGCIVWGIEPNSKAAEEAKEKIDVVINDIFSDQIIELTDVKFDCIFFNDVLEHLVNPFNALKLSLGFLEINGYIVASIPNIRYYPVISELLIKRDFEYKDHGVLDKTHLKFFTKKSMIRLFEEVGLDILKIEGINNSRATNKFILLNFLFFNKLSDMKYPQFGVLAKRSQ